MMLSAEDIQSKFMSYVPDYGSKITNMVQNAPTNNTQNVQKTYQFNGDLVFPNINDNSKVEDLIKELNNIGLKAEQRINRI